MAGKKGRSGRKKENKENQNKIKPSAFNNLKMNLKSKNKKKMPLPTLKENQIKSEPPPPPPEVIPEAPPAAEITTEPIEAVETVSDVSWEEVKNEVLKEHTVEVLQEKKENEKIDAEIKSESQSGQENQLQQQEQPSLEHIVALGMMGLGGVYVQTTGFKELDYTKEEIDTCAPIIGEMINYFFPDLGGLTERQKFMLIGGSMILKVHMDKLMLYRELSAKRDALNANTTKPNQSAN